VGPADYGTQTPEKFYGILFLFKFDSINYEMKHIEPLVILLSLFVGSGLAALPVVERLTKRFEVYVLNKFSKR
jgi:hypothetical protein